MSGDAYRVFVFGGDARGYVLYADVDARSPEHAIEMAHRVSGRHAKMVAFPKNRPDLHPDVATGRLPAAAEATLSYRAGNGFVARAPA